jgi:hypothetical protein
MSGISGDVSNVDLGSPTAKFRNVYAHDVFIDAGSLYVNEKRVIEDISDTITISTDPDQNLVVKTTGLGALHLKAEGGDVNVQTVGDGDVNVVSDSGIVVRVTDEDVDRGILITDNSQLGDITLSAAGLGSNLNILSFDQVDIIAERVYSDAEIESTGSISTDVGYKVNNTGPTGYFLRGDGTKFVAARIQAGDFEHVLGTPSDGSWTDGLLSFQTGLKADDALDGINEVLADLAPAAPPALDVATLTASVTIYSGKVPTGLSSNWSQATPGNTVSVIITNSFTLTSSAFGPGDQGVLQIEHNDSVIGTIDIATNFQESRRATTQDMTTWDTQGNGSAIVDGVISFMGGNFRVVSDGIYNNFKRWQAMVARLTSTSFLNEGYNKIRFIHVLSLSKLKMWEIYYDDDTNAPTFSGTPTVTAVSPTYNYLSGIRYYGLGSTFTFSYIGLNCFKKTYHTTEVSYYSMPGLNQVSRNPSSVPAYMDTFSVTDTDVALNASNVMNINARLTVGLRDPYGNNPTSQSVSANRLVNTYGLTSDAKREYFRDENYRLPLDTYDTIPEDTTGVWISQASLVNGEAQCYNSQLVYPTINFTTGYLPSQTGRNYSTFTGNQTYLRAFIDNNNPHSSVGLTIAGTSVFPQGQTGGLNVFIKLPTQTGWLDAGTMYSAATFTGIDNDGCQVSKVGNLYTLTFGTFSTANSGWMIIVKVVLQSSSHSITSTFSVNW